MPVVGSTGNATVTFMNKYLTPFGGKTDLGCGHYKFWTQSLNQELHFVDDGNVFDRGAKHLPSSMSPYLIL